MVSDKFLIIPKFADKLQSYIDLYIKPKGGGLDVMLTLSPGFCPQTRS